MYFTDRLSAPTSSFIPPPVTATEGSGYLPDCKLAPASPDTSLGTKKSLSLTSSTPIMVPSR
jgi:hypothetical protein